MSNGLNVDLKQESGYRFALHFAPAAPVVFSDEPPPLGQGTGPSPTQLLASLQQLDRALAQFEEFCTVTQSVRAAFPVEIEVYDSEGRRLK